MSLPIDNPIKETSEECLVDETVKRVWAVELDLLEQLQGICTRHGIPYYAIGGTLLGAVRHRGFIPWDDDIDVGMLRVDYDRFLKLCAEELTYPYELVTPLNDNCYRAHAQIRNSETTGYPKIDEKQDCNKGIFLDIFPLDGITDRKLAFALQMFEMKQINRILMNYFYFETVHENPPLWKSLFHRLVLFLLKGNRVKRLYRRYDTIAARYSHRATKQVGELSILFHDQRYHWDRSVFSETIMLPFEHTRIAVPAGWDEFLRNTFGDYMQIPKDKKERALHGDMVFAPDTPYKAYESKTNKHLD